MYKMKNRSVIRNIDWYLLAAVFSLTLLGFVNLYSATSALASMSLLKHQLFAFTLGVGIMIVIMFVDYSVLNRFAYVIYFVAITVKEFVAKHFCQALAVVSNELLARIPVTVV